MNIAWNFLMLHATTWFIITTCIFTSISVGIWLASQISTLKPDCTIKPVSLHEQFIYQSNSFSTFFFSIQERSSQYWYWHLKWNSLIHVVNWVMLQLYIFLHCASNKTSNKRVSKMDFYLHLHYTAHFRHRCVPILLLDLLVYLTWICNWPYTILSWTCLYIVVGK